MSAFFSALLNQGKSIGALVGPLLEIFRSPDLRRVSPLLAIAALLHNILGLILPMAILQIMDRVVLNQSLETLALLVIGVVVGLVIEELLQEVNGLVTSWLGARFEHIAGVDALSRLMHVPFSVCNRKNRESILSALRQRQKSQSFIRDGHCWFC